MDTLQKIKELVEQMSTDTNKVYNKGNHSAAIRARKNAQEIKNLIATFRKEILQEIKRHDAGGVTEDNVREG
jgi:Histone H1-like protein Hc1